IEIGFYTAEINMPRFGSYINKLFFNIIQPFFWDSFLMEKKFNVRSDLSRAPWHREKEPAWNGSI
ncbi:MAG: hypothetical protein WAO96_08520, partial [Limnochordia bacterium]